MKVVISWFKRDLRIPDNIPLLNAINSGFHIVPLFVIEPDLWRQKELSFRQYKFQLDCLDDLKNQGVIFVEKLDEIQESIVIGQSWDNDVRIILFIVLKKPKTLNDILSLK